MTDPTPTITVDVDPTNPGQFFACCGLLELADRLWPDTEAFGWFGNRQFKVSAGGGLRELLQALIAREPEVLTTLPNGLTAKPLIAPLRLSLGDGSRQTLVLDAWTEVRVDRGEVIVGAKSPWNFWSGQQTTERIWRPLRQAFTHQLATLADADLPAVFTRRLPLDCGRFGFDPGPAWTKLDVGFSPNEQGIPVTASAAVELLAAVGLQRFRPVVANDRASFVYATWGQPLPPAIAAVAAGGQTITPQTRRYRGRVIARGQYAALGYSTPLTGDSHD